MHPLPSSAGFCRLVPGFLDRDACAELIASSENRGFRSAASDYPPTYRNNSRQVMHSAELAARLEPGLRAHAPASLGAWELDSINALFRFCRYEPGQQFKLHQDGVHHRDAASRSCLTFMIYLTDGDDFEGGDTVFYDHGPSGDGHGNPPREIGRVRPRAGTLILFDHSIWHAGETLTSGVKHVLRSDVIYRCANAAASTAQGHQGYVWALAALDDAHFASGGRDADIRTWDIDGNALLSLRGHTQSVLGLAKLPGQRLASVSRDRTLRIWNWRHAVCEHSVRAHDAAVLDVISLGQDRMATCSADGTVKLWTTAGEHLHTFDGRSGWVWQMCLLDKGHMATVSEDGAAHVWDINRLKHVASFVVGTPLRSVLWFRDALWIGDTEGRVSRWRDSDGVWRAQQTWTAHTAAIRSLHSVGIDQLASCGEDHFMRLWDADACTLIQQSQHANFVTDALCLHGILFTSSYDGAIRRHDHV